MRTASQLLAVALCLALGGPVRAQWFDSLINPDVEVVLAHPPGLGIKVQRVAFAPVQTTAADELVSACIVDLTSTGQVEVLDRSNIEKVLKEQKFSNSGLVDEESAIELGRMLGSPLLLMVSVHNLKVTRMPHRSTKPEWKDRKGKIHPAETTYTSRTQVDYSASIQAVDLATGRVFSQQRLAVAPHRENVSDAGQPEYPSETEVRELAINEARTQVHRMLLPWTETRKLIFYDDREYGMKEAYKRLKLKDVLGALTESEKAVAKAKADTNVRAKFLGRTNYNVGICHFILGDYASAMPYLRAARETDAEHKIFLEAAKECERAIQLSEEMVRVEKRSVKINSATPASIAPPPATPGGTVEERLERLNNLRKQGLITQPEYEKRKAEILSEL
jgi:hypothetical protein